MLCMGHCCVGVRQNQVGCVHEVVPGAVYSVLIETAGRTPMPVYHNAQVVRSKPLKALVALNAKLFS